MNQQPMNGSAAPQRRDSGALRKALSSAWQWFRRVVLNNWQLKLLSLVIAMALWAGLITQDPTLTREKIFRDVTVTVNNTDLLRRNGYIVTSDLEALLQDVTVAVDVPQMQYADVQPSNYNIRVDLNRLEHRAGEQTLTIMTTNTATYGAVTRINPPTITVVVEEYVTHNYIPVTVVQEGETPAGFYATAVTRDPAWITVSGPRSLVEQVDHAEVVLNMSALPAREGVVERALTLTLMGENGQVIESDMLQVTRESVLRERVNVTVTLYPQREIDLLTAQLYTGKPAEGYEVTDVYVTPTKVTMAGTQSVVDAVDVLQPIRLVDVNGATETVTASIDLARPQNLQWINATRATVTVVIQPKKDTVRLTDIPVSIVGVPEGWTATVARGTVVVSVTGAQAWVTELSAEDVTVICDVMGLAAGVHEAPLQCRIAGAEDVDFLAETEPLTLQVTLTAPAVQ